MNPLDKVIIYAAAVLALGLGVWWGKAAVFKAIRAPVEAQLQDSKTANTTLVEARTKAEAETVRLNALLLTRAGREAKSNKQREANNEKFELLAKTNVLVQSWADLVIPADVIGMRFVSETTNTDGANSVRNPHGVDQSGAGATTANTRGDQRHAVEAPAIAGDATRSVQQSVAGRERILPAGKADDTSKEVKPSLRQKFNQLWSTK